MAKKGTKNLCRPNMKSCVCWLSAGVFVKKATYDFEAVFKTSMGTLVNNKLVCMKEYSFKREHFFDRKEKVFPKDLEISTCEANGNGIPYAVGLHPTSKQSCTKWN